MGAIGGHEVGRTRRRKRFFICYGRGVRAPVIALAEGLRKLDYQVWFDEKLDGGQVWWKEILKRIRDSDVFVVALAPETLRSEACKREWKYAVAVRRHLLPIIVTDGVREKTAPEELSRLHWVDYRRGDQKAHFDLFAALSRLSDPQPLPEPLPEPPPLPVSYLGGLKEKVETSDKLTEEEQKALIFDFQDKIDKQEDHTAILDLLESLKLRTDLLKVISTKIDDLETRLGGPVARPAAKAGKPAKTAARKASPKGTKKDGKKAPRRVTKKVTKKPTKKATGKPKKAAKKTPKKATAKKAPKKAAPKKTTKKTAKRAAKKTPKPAAKKGARSESELMVRLRGGNDDLIDLLGRVLEEKTSWQLEIDDLDNMTLSFEATRAGHLVAVASCRDKASGAKEEALKVLAWETSSAAVAKGLAAGAVAYATGGVGLLALGSKNVRDFMLRFRATRRWRVLKTGADLERIAGDIAWALRAIAPKKRAFIARKELPGP